MSFEKPTKTDRLNAFLADVQSGLHSAAMCGEVRGLAVAFFNLTEDVRIENEKLAASLTPDVNPAAWMEELERRMEGIK